MEEKTNLLSVANILFFFSPIIYFEINTYGMPEDSYEKSAYGAIFWLYPMVYIISIAITIIVLVRKIQNRKLNKLS